jgi:autotransporter-associated beta strand protein
LVQYTGTNPSLGTDWTTPSSSNPHIGNPQTSLLYAFTTSAGQLVLHITFSGTTVAGTWTNTAASGSWAAAANWDSNPKLPHTAGDLATFGNGASLTTVTLDGSKSVGAITFNNNNSYQITPGSGGTLTLDNNGAGASLYATEGTANQIQTPVALNDNVTVGVSGSKTLAVSGNIQNSPAVTKTLTVNSAGTLALSGNNSYGPGPGSYGTYLTGGATLQVGSSTALGTSDVSFAGNGTLQAGASVGLNNTLDVSPGVTATVDSSGNTLALNGVINDSGNLTKIGNGTLALPDNQVNNYTGTTTVNGGVLSVAYDGDVYQSSSIILNGGDLLANGQSDNGYVVNIDPPIGIGPATGSVGGTALIDATSGSTLSFNAIITSAGNTGANNIVVNSGANNNGIVYMGIDGNTFNGTTIISNGLLWVASSTPLAYSTLDYSNQGGYLVIDGGITGVTLGGLTGAQNLALTNLNGHGLSLTVGNNNGSTTYSGSLNDFGLGGSLTKVGTGTLTLSGTNSSCTGATAISAGVLRLNTNGVLNTLSASVAATGGAGLVVSGGFLTATNASTVGVGSAGLQVTSGSATFLGALSIPNNSDLNTLISVTGGSLTATNLSLGRSSLIDTTQPTVGSTAAGLYVNGGTVNILANLDMSSSANNASSVSARVDSGSLTVGGAVIIGLNNSGRWSVMDVSGGSLTVNDMVTGISVGAPNAGNAELLIRGGTVTAGIIGLGNVADLSTNTDTAVLNMTNGSLYVGAGGIVQVQPSTNLTPVITFAGGLLGATTNWSCTNNIQLTGASYTIQTADTNGNAQNIYLGGTLSGTGALIKTGAGTLVLSNSDSCSGATTISNGTLALVASGVMTNTPQIAIASGATFDVSALAGFAFAGTGPVQTLAGAGSSGAASIAAGANTVTLNSGAKALLHAVGGASPTVGKISAAGGLALNGNVVTINVGGGILGAGNYRLLDCTGTLSGSANATPAFTGLGATPGAAVSVITTAGSGGHVDLTVAKATPILQTATASTITNGSPLSASILFVTFTNAAGTNVPGTFAFTSPGTIPPVGTAGYQVQFTPNDTTDYNTPAAFNVNVTVLPSVLIPTTPAHISGFSLVNNTNVVINATNGETGGTYYLLESTNVAAPMSQWTAVATNVVNTNGASGAFTFTGTNAASSSAAQQFYILSNTNN